MQFRNVRIKRLAATAAKLKEDQLGSTPNVHRCGSLLLAGQPSQDDVPELKRAGVDVVIDLRLPGEIDWDESAVMTDAGLEYQRVPFRGAEALTDEVFGQIRSLLTDAKSKQRSVLLHCGSANRVGAVWLVHRVLDEGVGLDDAIQEAKEVGLRNPDYLTRAREYLRQQPARSKARHD